MTPDALQRQDEAQLKSLAVAFRVVGGLCAFCVNFAWLHVIVGFVTILGGTITPVEVANSPSRASMAPAALSATFGGVFIFIGLLVIATGYTVGYFGFRAAKGIETSQNWNLCFGTSIAFMLFQPIGLVLGILSLIVLNRPSVRQMFV